MKQFKICLLLLLSVLTSSGTVQAQLFERAEQLIQTAFSDNSSDSLTVEERYRRDSVRLHEMTLQMQEMKLNEILLRNELDNALNRNHKADSLKTAEQRRAVDSLRAVTAGVPVIVDGDTLFTLYAARGGYSPFDRAEMINDNLLKIGKDKKLRRDSVHTLENDGYTDIMYGNRMIFTLSDQDAIWQGVSRQVLADLYTPILEAKIKDLQEGYSWWQIVKRAVLFILVVIVQYLLFKLTNYLFRKLRRQ
ncbi:MAG: mechanosensitive ion channel family protein, partial [Muribaculaceae bacterium]|nr:mechanosensitive ion channel family protein [Muribaculaceae bacterium]